MQFVNPQEAEARVAARYQTMLILWIAMMVSLGFFLALAVLVHGSGGADRTISSILFSISLVCFIASMLIKHHRLKQAIERQKIELLLNAYIIGFALCEVTALFGLTDHFITGSRNYRFACAMAVIGMLLHFPKKEHLRAVSTSSPRPDRSEI
jgi:fumarate reductase subunit D